MRSYILSKFTRPTGTVMKAYAAEGNQWLIHTDY